MRIAMFAALVAVAACSKKASNDERGMAPASEWQGSGTLAPMGSVGGSPAAKADMAEGAALPPGHPAIGGAAPNGMDTGGGMTGAAPDLPPLPPPDPTRKLDPSHHITGTIAIDPRLKDKVKPGTPVFLTAKMLDASGQPISPPLAVERLDWTDKDSLAFSLDESNAMTKGTELKGEVLVSAHYDLDGEARSKTPGDVIGQLKVKIPSDGVKIILDTLVE